jgi:hypothetical protein
VPTLRPGYCSSKRAARTAICGSHIPAGFYRNIFHPDITWHFETEPQAELGADQHHGAGGPLDVTDLRARHELHDTFMGAAEEAG